MCTTVVYMCASRPSCPGLTSQLILLSVDIVIILSAARFETDVDRLFPSCQMLDRWLVFTSVSRKIRQVVGFHICQLQD